MQKRVLKILSCFLLLCAVIFSKTSVASAQVDEYVYVGGFATGFSIGVRGAEVVGLCDVVTTDGVISPAKSAGIMVGDRLMSIDATQINTASDIEKALKGFNGDKVVVVVKRKGESVICELKPVKDVSGDLKIGLFIRDNLNGIGTMTFIKENREFMALGHPICDENEQILEIISGNVYPCSIIGINKSHKGKAGELRGVFSQEKSIGAIYSNFNQGIRGKLCDDYSLENLNKVAVGSAKIGSATMITSISGEQPREFDISIVKVSQGTKTTKNYVIKVDDKELLERAGGIVQGMSGSPILQDGKIVGAVTHVFLNDTSRGYGISIENMLSAS